ncbi:MAG: cyclase [Anaerolineae bacterium]|nr:cyclase [Anaerolineae bacterium]
MGQIDRSLAEQALDWLAEHQLEDGSWGADWPFYYHDRIVCTLAAMTTLVQYGHRVRDQHMIERGQQALEKITSNATHGLAIDPCGATIAFELIAPMLVVEAEALGLLKNQKERILGRLGHLRAIKLKRLKGIKINRFVTAAFSAEMVGSWGTDHLDQDSLQDANGSVAYSPAATAFYALHMKPGDVAALSYLQRFSVDGALPYVAPIDGFELGWSLWNLTLGNRIDDEIAILNRPHLDFLARTWKKGEGIAAAIGIGFVDSDAVAIVHEVLGRMGYATDIEALLRYEEDDCFRCYELEANPSIGANVHILGALRQAGLEVQHPAIRKILSFLRGSSDTFWFDKWHISPYYATAHAIIACAGYADNMVHKAVDWILDSQNDDGSWGYYGDPTAEETAYCLQALAIWDQCGGSVSHKTLEAGKCWLMDHAEPPYPPLWIGKCLYTPELPVRSAILSALQLVT